MAAVIVHGGAFAVPDSIADDCIAGCRAAAAEAYAALTAGKSAVDAVEVAVRSLEDNPIFNAGHGAIWNEAGQIEMDAIIVDGSNLSYGAVAGVKEISNPVSLARLVMDKTEHVMLIGEGANAFAADMGIPRINPDELVSPLARMRWETHEKYAHFVSHGFNVKDGDDKKNSDDGNTTGHASHDTVGAVAMDFSGNIAAATSTGGITMKKVGRLGDSAMIGSGAYCDNNLGGVSCTGHGEAIAKVVLSFRALQHLQPTGSSMSGNGGLCSLEDAFKKSLGFMLEHVGGSGGMIGIGKDGVVAKHYTTPRMSWASVDKNGQVQSGL